MTVSENGASRQETASSERLTPEQEILLGLIRSKASLPLEEVSDRIDDVRSLIGAGRVALTVRENVWGVEFALTLRTAGNR
jgi:hypothetical protein